MSSASDTVLLIGTAALAFLAGLAVVPGYQHVRWGTRRRRLIDAASPLHPLMKRLMAEAPGTFMHSVAAANLAEAAAEVVEADALVARVGAYYHDIGKLRRPCFFFENLEEGDNPHDGWSASDSAEVIRAHVTDGLKYAAEYRLPRSVADIIGEHHGTSLVRYFYHQATAAGVSVFEADYRYPGRPPHTKEAGIVMLADACEAAVRAMDQPTTAEIAACVRSVIEDKRRDDQLTATGLNSQDLELIAEVFVRYLVGFRHARCAYPNETTKGTAHADQRAEPSGA